MVHGMGQGLKQKFRGGVVLISQIREEILEEGDMTGFYKGLRG